MKQRKISLVLKIMLLCLLLVVFTSVTMQIIANKTSRNTVIVAMGETALNITRSVINIVDIEKFEELETSEDMQMEYYTQLRQQLNEVKENLGLKYLYTMRVTEAGEYIYVVDGAPEEDTEVSLLGDIEEDITDKMRSSVQGKEGYELSYSAEWGNLISAYMPIKNQEGKTVGILAADFEADHIVKQLKDANNQMYLITTIIILIGIAVSIAFSFMIIRSLKSLQAKVQLLKQGDLTIEVKNNSKDEVGQLSEAFQDMLENMAFIIRNILSNTEEVIQKIIQLNHSVSDTSQASEEISKTINEIASGATEQVENVEHVSNSMEKVFEEIRNITVNIDLANAASNEAMKDSREAAELLKGSVNQINLVNDTVETTSTMMKQLETRFHEILTFSDSVTAIASQTNLLALNASIEATSAGVHGKGFAVVAGEIKNLARQSSDASKRIKELINLIQEEINNSSKAIENGVIQAKSGVEVIAKVDTYLDKLFLSNQKVDNRIKEITGAISNIENDSRFVLDSTIKLSDIARDFSAGTQQTAAATEEQQAIMEEIQSNLGLVRERMESLGVSVKTFKVD